MNRRYFVKFLQRSDGTAAIEFAIIAPVFFLTVFSMIAYGIYLSAAHSVQQISADAARVAVAGLSETERQTLARDFIQRSMIDHPFMDAQKFDIQVADDTGNPNQFTVSVKYDADDLPIWSLYSYAMPDKEIVGYSTIRLGGL
ncbi:TadE/TadG family type IV pilus assembly protein [Nitratireductor kimnyeongensis]|uniref:TadE/TadG family type IV pilus assembly protein n=1 Tax=Nitratireductor kimnyeongensis TaxID=430679 RepID=A0ABW0T2Y4_9HYPH|nr:TadE/TadG family type IV pilus assembly protein [Nitratireductor kimnyeongensis]QZZ35238.1 pilus assembly protein [Nitratireductor kimnyeongensis]